MTAHLDQMYLMPREKTHSRELSFAEIHLLSGIDVLLNLLIHRGIRIHRQHKLHAA